MDAPDGPPGARAVREPDQIGAYRILERISEGGMGVVYRAEQRAPVRRVVALKVVKVGMDTKEVVARFEAERQALALMSHPNVAKVFDAGVTESGRPYFAMEYVPGVPLTDYCDEHRLTIRERLELFAQVCQAVQHAHQKGIIHRDLKPSNILVAQFEGRAVPKVIDFGIAKAMNQALTQQTLFTHAGTMVGTPEYASPEQVFTSGLDVDTRTDIYSLGVILYQLLTGTLPLDPRTLRKAGPEEMVRIIREDEPPRPSTRLSAIRREPDAPAASNGDRVGEPGLTQMDVARRQRTDPRALWRQVRGDLDWITLKAMDKDRTRRYETANALANDVRRYLHDEPVAARPPNAIYQVRKFVRRHRFGAGATAAVVFALIGGIIGTTAGLVRAIRAEQQEKAEAKKTSDLQVKVVESVRSATTANNQVVRRLLQEGGLKEAKVLAGSTARTARRTLAIDPLTWDAEDLTAQVALAQHDLARARHTLEPLVAEVRGHAALKTPTAGRYFEDLADAIELQQSGSRRDVEQLLADAVQFYAGNPLAEGRAARRLAVQLEDHDQRAAGELYLKAISGLRAAPGTPTNELATTLDGYRDFLLRQARFEDALKLVDGQLLDDEAQRPDDNPSLPARMLDVVSIGAQLGRRGDAARLDDAARRLDDLVKYARGRSGGFDGLPQYYWRELALRSGLENYPDAWASQTIRGRLWLAMTDALVASPSRTFQLEEIEWGQLSFELRRWQANGNPVIASGNLAKLRGVPDPPPGVYLLTVTVPRRGAQTLRAAAWLLFAKWDLRLYYDVAGGRPDAMPARLLLAMQDNAAPIELRTANALLLCKLSDVKGSYAGLRIGAGPSGRLTGFGIAATTQIELPPGYYRFSAGSDDGVSLSVDNLPRIDSWRHRPVATDSVAVDVPRGKHDVNVKYFQGGGDFLLNVTAEPMDDRATKLTADALGGGDDAGSAPPSPLLRQWLIDRAAAWEQAEDFQRAADGYLQAAAVGCELPAIDRADQARVTRARARCLARLAVPDPAAQTADDVLKVAEAAPHGAQARANAQLDRARADLAAGRPVSEVAPALARAVALWHRGGDGSDIHDRRARDFLRYAQLLAIGAGAQGSDGSVTGQVLCAADEMLRNEPALELSPDALAPSSVHYRLVRWDGAAAAPPPADPPVNPSLADPSPSEPHPGLYVLRVEIDGAGPGGTKLIQAYWLLFCPWQFTMYSAERESVFNRDTFTAMVSADWTTQGTFLTKGLALLDAFGPDPMPPAPAAGCGIQAWATTPSLPRGRYRVEVTASDGARLSVGPYYRLINAWPLAQPARADSAEIELGNGRQRIDIDFFHGTGAHKLWLRFEPLAPAARAFADKLGRRRARPLAVALREQDEALIVDPQNLAAFAARAGIHVQMRQLKEADSDYTGPADIDFKEPLWPLQRALVALRDNQKKGYERQREEMLARAAAPGAVRKDRSLAARILLTSRLSAASEMPGGRRVTDLEALVRSPGPAWQQPVCDLATGVGSYRAGKLGEAIKSLLACRDRLPPAAQATAELFRAMALQQSGDRDGAEEALRRGSSLVEQLGRDDQPEWDTYLVQDWLTCQIVLDEAKALLHSDPAAPRAGNAGVVDDATGKR